MNQPSDPRHREAVEDLPRLVVAVLNRVLPDRLRDNVLGDLREEFRSEIVPRSGPFGARLWAWRQVIALSAAYCRERADWKGGLTAWGGDLRIAVRSLGRSPMFSFLVILTLALGIGSNAAIFSLVNTVLLNPTPFRRPERLVQIQAVRGGERGKISLREIRDIREQSNIFEGVAAYYPGSRYTHSSGGRPEKLPAILMTHNLFEVLGVPLALGAAWPEDFDRSRNFGLILSHNVWKRRFGGDPGVVGRKIALDNASSYVIYGVLREGVDFPVHSDLYRSIFISRFFPNIEDRASRGVLGVARLRPGITVDAARRHLADLARQFEQRYPTTNMGVGFELSPLRESFVGETRPYLLLLWGAVGLLLLITCANVANLLMGRAVGRQQQTVVRLALGASRWRLVRQVATESILLSSIGAVLGLLLADRGVGLLTQLIRFELPSWMRFEMDARVLLFTMAVAVLTALFSGVLPALRSSHGDLAESLKSGGRGGSAGAQRGRLRSALVVAEISLSVVLLVGAGLLVRTFLALTESRLGFDTHNTLTFQVALPWTYDETRVNAFQRETMSRIAALPGVTGVALNTNLPLAQSDLPHQKEIVLEGQSPDQRTTNPFVNVQTVGESYFDTLRIQLSEGREFQPTDDVGTPRVALISRRLAGRLWPGRSAVGRRFRVAGEQAEVRWLTVVGVVGDVRSSDLVRDENYDVYLSLRQVRDGWTYYAVKTATDPHRIAEAAAQGIWAVDPEQAVYDVMTFEERLMRVLWRRRAVAMLFAVFAALAAFLAAAGIYGVVSNAVQQRTREIGIRLALGATPRQVLRQVIWQGLQLAAGGIMVGLICSLALVRTVVSLVYGVSPFDPITFAGVPLLLVAVTVAATLHPARSAMRVDPVVSLRQE